jgi:ubiquitin C-terminal hydrolase
MEIIYYLYKADSSHQNRNQFFEKFIFPVINQLVDTSKKNSLRIMHVGLTNFGSTCYLNSMLQVLNATDIFRNAIMKV